MKRKAVSVVMTMILLAAGTLAGQTITLSKKTGSPTAALTVSGTGFAAKAAIDIYFDTTDEVLVIASSTGAFTAAPVTVPATALPGSHWISAVQRSTGTGVQVAFSVNTNWSEGGFGPRRRSSNTYENVLSPATVGNLDRVWNFPLNNYAGDAAVVNGVAYFGSDDTNVYAVNTTTGAKLWSFKTGGSVEDTPNVANGIVYVGSGDGNFYALNATTGAKVWSFTPPPPAAAIQTSAIVVNGLVMFGSVNHTFYALNATTGALVWSFPTGGVIIDSPAAAGGVVYFGSDDNNFYALNAATGAKLWSVTTGGAIQYSPVIGNGVVYFGSGDGNFYALNSTTGATLWTYAGSNVYVSAFANNTVFIGSNSNLIALNPSNGATIWNDAFTSAAVQSLSVANGVVYTANFDTVYALNASNGQQLWTYTVGGFDSSSPAIANGQVFISSFNTGVYAFALPTAAAAKPPKPPAIRDLRPDLSLKPWCPTCDVSGMGRSYVPGDAMTGKMI